MPLETATYTADLNSANPAHTDDLNQTDAHLRLIKATLKGTFPNFTSAPLESTQAALDSAVSAVNTTGVSVLADAGAHFKTNTGDGFANPAAGEVDVLAGTHTVVKFKDDLSASFQGAVSATGGLTGPGAVPVGGTVIWWTDTLPGASWAWCNGGTYLRSNAALWALFGTTFGAGDGVATANLPDLRDNVPVGKGTMGGATAAGRIAAGVTGFVSSVVGAIFGEGTHKLVTGEMPAHAHGINDPGHSHNFNTDKLGPVQTMTGVPWSNTAGGNNGPSGGEGGVNFSIELSGTGVTLQSTGGDAAHSNVQPSTVCNWIIRIA